MTRHAYIDGDPTNPGHIYFEQDGARLRCELEPDDVIAALDAHMEHTGIVDAMAQEIENLRAELDGRAPVGPTAHWSPWLEWRGGPCPLPVDTVVEVGFRGGAKDDSFADDYRWVLFENCDDIIRFRYRSPDPAGWLPRGEFIPPAELWDEGCPVRCEWINATVDSSAVQREQMTPSTWSFATHIRLVARQPQAELPEGFRIEDQALYSQHGAVLGISDYEDYGPAAIRQAVDAWLYRVNLVQGHYMLFDPNELDDLDRIAEACTKLAARERARRTS